MAKRQRTTGTKKRTPKRQAGPAPVKVESLRHRDTRKNIPTEELRDFVREDEHAPKTMLYPRDPSLDPQLVWKGKDEQDSRDLEVPIVPIYIQEKIHPQAIIDALPRIDRSGGQADLFADFNGLPEDFDQRVDFYRHEANWTNRMILGDSLLVMTSLAEKEGLKGKVQTIYLDPPYGIKFGSNWQVSTRKRDVKDGKAEDATRQPEQIRAFRDTWKLGIHSYLAYLRDRLTVARELLTETGSIFVQIGDENVHLVRCVLDEVFGSENFVSLIPFRKKTMPLGAHFCEQMDDFILWYAKQKFDSTGRPLAKYRQLFNLVPDEPDANFKFVEESDGTRRSLTMEERRGDVALPEGARLYRLKSLEPSGPMASGMFRAEFEGRQYDHPKNGYATDPEGISRLILVGRVQPSGRYLNYVLFLDDSGGTSTLTVPWGDTAGASDKTYVVQTSNKVVERCLLMTTDPGDLVLDPTCGSGTTAYVAEQWGRRWITCDTSRVALALARTRLMAARFPYYLLADSPEGAAKEAEITGQTPPPHKTLGDIRKGFVYRRVPHITLKSIANNEEIDVIHARWQPQIKAALAALNQAAGTNWREWEVPRELPANDAADADRPANKAKAPRSSSATSSVKSAAPLLAEYWALRRQRQAEIDAAIARHADQELLYDQPYEDRKTVRVTGPFTVESLSPHRTISVEEKVRRATVPDADGRVVRVVGPDQFATMILDNLRKAGVQNTVKSERLVFDSIEPFAGEWIHGEGRYREKDGTERRAAICIGPEHGTVGAQLVKEAAKEAVKGVGFDVLIVCGFAFDPSVSEEAKRYGRLTVLAARMNPDLAMGDELLKKTGAGNLFTVFGEPDVEIRHGKEGVTVEIRGVDVYDPTTGEIRSGSTDDIACWFIDTEYNGESFFVRHAYFTGADEPYERLKRALRAEIDEAAWASLYSTVSRPFPRPKSGKIAVKVINHYGDEVLKVFDVT